MLNQIIAVLGIPRVESEPKGLGITIFVEMGAPRTDQSVRCRTSCSLARKRIALACCSSVLASIKCIPSRRPASVGECLAPDLNYYRPAGPRADRANLLENPLTWPLRCDQRPSRKALNPSDGPTSFIQVSPTLSGRVRLLAIPVLRLKSFGPVVRIADEIVDSSGRMAERTTGICLL